MGSGGGLGEKHAHKVSGKKIIGLSSKERVLESNKITLLDSSMCINTAEQVLWPLSQPSS